MPRRYSADSSPLLCTGNRLENNFKLFYKVREKWAGLVKRGIWKLRGMRKGFQSMEVWKYDAAVEAKLR
jgi:hypothetical protein